MAGKKVVQSNGNESRGMRQWLGHNTKIVTRRVNKQVRQYWKKLLKIEKEEL